MTRLLVGVASVAVVLGTFAAPASAIRPCDTTDVSCHRTCTLPHFDRERGLYWYYC